MFQALKNLFSATPEVRVPYAKGLPVTDENKFGEEAEEKQWIGVDLDGTLLTSDGTVSAASKDALKELDALVKS